MREIKFRAWNNRRKCITKSWTLLELIENGTEWGKTQDKRANMADFDFAVMQYTGLKDKNGKEIYEGDILSMPYGGYPSIWKVGELSEHGLTFSRITIKPYSAPYFFRDLRHFDKAEIIGNIYENPDLLAP